mmetsp:Transcript_72992/g.158424  ORF Transcript_72992/g.158424 Transcript_72992/m.158424 type:complete len:91 (-) Transcript_72992:6-278(-)
MVVVWSVWRPLTVWANIPQTSHERNYTLIAAHSSQQPMRSEVEAKSNQNASLIAELEEITTKFANYRVRATQAHCRRQATQQRSYMGCNF